MEKNILALDLGKGSLGIALSRSGMLVSLLPNIRFKMGDYQTALKELKEVLFLEKIEHTEPFCAYPDLISEFRLREG